MDEKNIIKDYFSITGRPISTMTVEEYLRFQEFLSKGSLTNSSPLSLSYETNQVTRELDVPVTKEKSKAHTVTSSQKEEKEVAKTEAKIEKFPVEETFEDKVARAKKMMEKVKG